MCEYFIWEAKMTGKRGFALMSLKRRREIASLGGQASQARGTAHRWTPEEATEAGKRAKRHKKDKQ